MNRVGDDVNPALQNFGMTNGFISVAEILAAEQRPVVAHSASYGLDRPENIQAPSGAEESRVINHPIDLWHIHLPIC